MIWYEQAAERLDKEFKSVTGDKELVMRAAVRDTLLDFCRQDDEFAQAVVQGGDFKGCMSAVAKGVGRSISDMEAYRRAVAYYFPGAGIRMTMRIDLCDSVKDTPHPDAIVLNLLDFL